MEINTEEKIEAELSHIESKIFSLADKLNNIYSKNYELSSKEIKINEEKSKSSEGKKEESSEENEDNEKKANSTEISKTTILNTKTDEEEIEWQDIKTEIESISSLWSIISIDLKNKKVADNEIEEFNNNLNQTMLSIKNESKEETLKNITNLYSIIPIFISYTSQNENKATIKNVKLEVLKAYNEANLENWDAVSAHITNAENIFFNLQRSNEEIEKQRFKIDKIERLLQNLANSISVKDLQVFLVHYKTLIENIDTI